MKKIPLSLVASAGFFLLTASLHAQIGNTDGCASSPENPTVVLALVGSAGAAAASLRARIKARRNSR